jgi:hypothetical protein
MSDGDKSDVVAESLNGQMGDERERPLSDFEFTEMLMEWRLLELPVECLYFSVVPDLPTGGTGDTYDELVTVRVRGRITDSGLGEVHWDNGGLISFDGEAATITYREIRSMVRTEVDKPIRQMTVALPTGSVIRFTQKGEATGSSDR